MCNPSPRIVCNLSPDRTTELRPRIEELSAAEPSDRLLVRWKVWAYRLEALTDRALGQDARPAITRAVDAAGTLVQEQRATNADVSEYASALNFMGEIASAAGQGGVARRCWERTAELLAPRITGCRDWRLLDPAARAADDLGRTELAREIIAQLNQIGYVPLEPWPERPDRPR